MAESHPTPPVTFSDKSPHPPAQSCDIPLLKPLPYRHPDGAEGNPMKTIALSLASSALVLGLSLSAMAAAPADGAAPVVEGKDRPILLARMVVTATPLPN